jgi:hypothetical protein
LEVNA